MEKASSMTVSIAAAAAVLSWMANGFTSYTLCARTSCSTSSPLISTSQLM